MSKQDISQTNVQIGYQAAVSLWTYEGGLIWSRYNAMLVANSIIAALVGLSLTTNQGTRWLSVAGALAGMIVSVVWILIVIRGFAYHKYWVASVRELEDNLAGVCTVVRGRRFSRGETVEVAGEQYRMNCLGGLISVEIAALLVVLTFVAAYVAAFGFALVASLSSDITGPVP